MLLQLGSTLKCPPPLPACCKSSQAVCGDFWGSGSSNLAVFYSWINVTKVCNVTLKKEAKILLENNVRVILLQEIDLNHINGQEGNQSLRWQGVFILRYLQKKEPPSTGSEPFPYSTPPLSPLLEPFPSAEVFPEDKVIDF